MVKLNMMKLNILQVFNPNRWKAFRKYTEGLKWTMRGRTVDACDAFRQAVSLHTNNPVYRAMLGIAYADLQNYQFAIRELLLSIEYGIMGNRLASEAYGFLGLSYLQTKNYNEAIRSFEKSLELFRDSTSRIKKGTLYQNLAGLYRRQGQFDKSISMYKNALEERPNDAELCILLGLSYLECGQNEAGNKAVKKGLELDPSLANKYPSIKDV